MHHLPKMYVFRVNGGVLFILYLGKIKIIAIIPQVYSFNFAKIWEIVVCTDTLKQTV